MINLRNSPFLWLALLLLIAYKLADYVNIFLPGWISLLYTLAMLACIYGSVLRYNPSRTYWSTFSISALVLMAGIWRGVEFRQELYPTPILSKPIYLDGTVSVEKVLKNKESSITLQCSLQQLSKNTDTVNFEFGDRYFLLMIRNPLITPIFPRDQINVKGWISPIPAPLNPFAFDARIYYNTLGMRHELICRGEDILVHPVKTFSIRRLTARWQWTLSTLIRAHTSAQVAQVINALVWGDRSDMDSEVRDAFADSGAMHVLSVSGMHVAMVYSILFLFFGTPGEGVFLKRIFRFMLYASAILLYVGLTGASPAVVRAGLMILLYLFGKTMGWNTQIWNLLGFAAFMMLWLNPYAYYNIGFQLSFLAIVGILLYAKPIIRSLPFKSKILHWTWEIISLSLAAQVFIVPILLRQFHQFPLTFIISSLVAIPAAYLIIVGALLNVIFSLFGMDWLWAPLNSAGYYFIQIMKWISALNPAMNYSMTPAAGWLIFLMTLVFSAALVYQWPKGKYMAYGFGIGAMSLLVIHRSTAWSCKELIIYYAFHGILMDINNNGFCYSFVAGDFSPEQEEFAARGNRCEHDMISIKKFNFDESICTDDLHYRHYNLNFSKYAMLILNNNNLSGESGIQYSHVLILQADSLRQIKNTICQYPEAVVILPAHLTRKLKNNLALFLNQNDISFYDIAQSGYFRLSP